MDQYPGTVAGWYTTRGLGVTCLKSVVGTVPSRQLGQNVYPFNSEAIHFSERVIY